jgi:outer membrane protein assembly factor BamB
MKELSPCLALLLLAGSTPGYAATDGDDENDWPQHLGPNRNGKTVLSGVDFDWSDGGPEVLWRMEVGPGFGGASVRDGEVVFLDREVGEVDILLVLDIETGEEIWSTLYEAPGRLSYAGSRTVPTITEKYIYTCGGQGRVVCYDREKRDEEWSLPLDEVYGGVLPGYGWSCSPVVIGDTVVLSALGQEVGLVALDRFTGDEVWVTEPVGISHATPVVLTLLGEPQIVFVSTPMNNQQSSLNEAGTFTIHSYDLEDGTLKWETETLGSTYPIPGPVQVDDERFFVTGGYRGGSSMMRIAKNDDGYQVESEFRIERGSQVHNPILHDDHLYFVANENWNEPRNRRAEGGLMCLSLDGEERWRTKADPYFGRGHTLLAGDYLLIQDGINGILRVARATSEGYEQVAETDLFGITDRRDHQMWAPMALAGRHLLIRSQDELLCVKL